MPLDVVIEGGRITGLLPAGEAVAADAVVDAHGGVLVPGYVEPHAHLSLVAEPVTTLEQLAARGTTAVVADTYPWVRSEEHTSELQSRENLVCRLLLEQH